ncbi:MAG: PKD domain-containing protein [Candidatus Pacebacteria bacterium]|nr:PKD domain-containing protein [Candidatus Paceibacterota bacterium]
MVFYAKVNSGNYYQFIWDFGDTTENVEGQQVLHKYTSEGNYTIMLVAYDGTNYDTVYLELVVSNTTPTGTIFRLKSSNSSPNAQGKLQYTLEFLRSVVPPPVPSTGPYFYTGSNPESSWDEVLISSNNTNATHAWYTITAYDTVYSQAFGGWANGNINGDPVWANMEGSEFFTNFGYLKVGFQEGDLYTQENWEPFFPGTTGDDLPYPPVRITVEEDQITVYVDIRRRKSFEENVYWPQVKYKYASGASWSSFEDMVWVGGSGYAKVTLPRDENYGYYLRFWSDKDHPESSEVFLPMSSLYNFEEDCIYFEVMEGDVQ